MRLINTCNSIWGAFAWILREIRTKCFCDPQSDCRLLSRKVLCQSEACFSVECRVSPLLDMSNYYIVINVVILRRISLVRGWVTYIGHFSDVFINIHSPVFWWHSKLYSKNAVTIPSLSSLRSGIRTRFRTRKSCMCFRSRSLSSESRRERIELCAAQYAWLR